jgi:hypothetical protein
MLPRLRQFCLLGSIALVIPAVPVCAQETTDSSWQVDVKLKTLLNSHTSYEFGNPLPPYQRPLSRLAFPVDSVWAGLAVKKQLSRFSVGAEFLTTVQDQDTGRFKDTDWDDAVNPKRITNYGETGCRLLPSYQISSDIAMQMADMLHLPQQFDLRPVAGFRWQQLSLVAHDGTQTNYDIPWLAPSVQIIQGDAVAFKQNWYQFFTGVRFGYEWQNLPAWLHRLKLQSQLDWSYVEGTNRDNHLLQTSRISTADTSGDAWHASLGLLLGLTRNLALGVEADYLNIQTTGTYVLNDGGAVSGWSNGVKVWSEQFGMSVTLGYTF